eukprot:Hpha_TRINITY_DN14126_c0_g3::TRINITY_DN14126_c0_g3_i1::g.10674::m.10674
MRGLAVVVVLAVVGAEGARRQDRDQRQRNQQRQQRQQSQEEQETETPEQAEARIKRERQNEEAYFNDVYMTDDFDRHKDGQVTTTREDQIQELEGEHYALMRSQVFPARDKFEMARARLAHEKSTGGWFWSDEKKARVAQLEAETQQARAEYASVEAQAVAVYKQIKPLYGVVSWQHWAEHKRKVTSSVSWSADVGMNNAWWETIFRGSRSESLGDLVANIVISFVSGFLMAYFFSFIHFVFTAPFLIAEYCSGIGDIPAALLMFVVGVSLFILPLLLICLGCAGAAKFAQKHQMHQRHQMRQQRVYGGGDGGGGQWQGYGGEIRYR